MVDIMTKKVYARIISRESAMVDLGDKHIGDYDKINKEVGVRVEIKSEIPAKRLRLNMERSRGRA